MLKAAEEIHLSKPLKAECGGGLKELVQADIQSFDGTECEESFFSSQERQTLVLHLLHSLRAGPAEAAAADVFGKLRLIEGQAIGMYLSPYSFKIAPRKCKVLIHLYLV